MKQYYLNLDTTTNPNADNEVHTSDCWRCPSYSRIYLGYWDNGVDAVKEAKARGYAKADGCRICSKEAHKE